MEIGVYTFVENTPDPATGRLLDPAQRLRDLIEEVALADQVGLDVFGIGEHHRPDFLASAPTVLLAAAAERSKTHPVEHGGHRAELGRSGAGLRAVRHPRPSLRRARRDHGRARLVHRVVPAVRLRPRRLRRAVRGKARAAAGRSATTSASPGRARIARRCTDQGVYPRTPEPNPDLDRGRRQPAVGGARRHAQPADGARHHRRHARALRAVRQPVPPGRARGRPRRGQGCRLASTPTAMSPTPRSRPPTSSSRATPRR